MKKRKIRKEREFVKYNIVKIKWIKLNRKRKDGTMRTENPFPATVCVEIYSGRRNKVLKIIREIRNKYGNGKTQINKNIECNA